MASVVNTVDTIIRTELPCAFKIGITSNYYLRWEFGYWLLGFSRMHILFHSDNAKDVANLEIALISHFQPINSKDNRLGCWNIAKGGEGGMHKCPPPYFCYLVTGNAAYMMDTRRARKPYCKESPFEPRRKFIYA